MSGFTRGLVTGAIIGAAISMMMPERRHSKFSKTLKGSKKWIKTANNVIEDIMDM
jgi:gas vesicle protein